MDEEKINQTLEIILPNQAQFYADLQKNQETNKEAEKRVGVLERATVNLYNAQTKTNETVEKVAVTVDSLAGQVKGLLLAQKQTDERLKETDERLRETNERLNAVIFMAEKYFSRDNGKSEN